MKYWHELNQIEIDNIIENNRNWGYILKEYKQPDFCNYPQALNGKFGCWSLLDF